MWENYKEESLKKYWEGDKIKTKSIDTFKEKFIERGLTPLEEIFDCNQKVNCIDKDGYKYRLSYKGSISNHKTKNFDRWNKNNPFKAYNMRLYAQILEPDVKILSCDEELFNATHVKIKFECPICHQVYLKKWCHWIAEANGKHNCPQCNFSLQSDRQTKTYRELIDDYHSKGLKLLASYEEYKGNHTRLLCEDEEGYRYNTSLILVNNGNFQKYNKFSWSNPNASYNFKLWCNYNNIKVELIKLRPRKTQRSIFKCQCGNIFEASLESFMSGKRRCNKCVALDSKYSLMTKQWLEFNGFSYTQEYRFKDCKDKRVLPFDYYVPVKDSFVLIEVDGAHHFYITEFNNEDTFALQQKHDKIKDEYCASHGYKLIRIPYWLYHTDTYKEILNQTFFG